MMKKHFMSFTTRRLVRTFAICCAMTTTMFTACTDIVDNPVNPEPVNPETPEQQAFWAPFDAWKTDSCTVGDDFFMHMIGSWWKNPVDIYPGGLLDYATQLNTERVNEIIQTNADLQHLQAHITENFTMSNDEVEQMVKAKADELWEGASTREEALAALGRAWAQGYTTSFEPIVDMVNGVATWKATTKVPSFLSVEMLLKNKEEWWRFYGSNKIASTRARRSGKLETDLDIIAKGMNLGVDHFVVAEEETEILQQIMDTEWNTVEGIRNEIELAVRMFDGVLVNDDCLAEYNKLLPEWLKRIEVENGVELTREEINYYLLSIMANMYILNDYNKYYITPDTRTQYAEWCEKFREAMRQRIETNTWLENETRQNALDKLENIVFYVGGIDVIPDFVVPTLNGKNVIEDAHQLYQARMDGYIWATKQERATVALLVQNLRYISDATIDNASYSPNYNIVNINPSNLCSPYVEENYEDALQWAYIGTTIGHELTHGFDSNGSKYDLWGNQVDWWTEADAAKFKALCDQLTYQYDNLQLMPWVDPTLYGDGEKTLSENIADLGGCCLALEILLSEHPKATAAEMKAIVKRYFQGWAIQWSTTYNLKSVIWLKDYDVHSQARERTNGVVRNIDAWYDAFDIKSGALYLAPANRIKIW